VLLLLISQGVVHRKRLEALVDCLGRLLVEHELGRGIGIDVVIHVVADVQHHVRGLALSHSIFELR